MKIIMKLCLNFRHMYKNKYRQSEFKHKLNKLFVFLHTVLMVSDGSDKEIWDSVL